RGRRPRSRGTSCSPTGAAGRRAPPRQMRTGRRGKAGHTEAYKTVFSWSIFPFTINASAYFTIGDDGLFAPGKTYDVALDVVHLAHHLRGDDVAGLAFVVLFAVLDDDDPVADLQRVAEV